VGPSRLCWGWWEVAGSIPARVAPGSSAGRASTSLQDFGPALTASGFATWRQLVFHSLWIPPLTPSTLPWRHIGMDAVDEALARSREDRLAASLAAFKSKYARRQGDRAVRQARRRAGLALRHQAKLARIPAQRVSN
jgi:hypothetical protein